MPPLEIGVESIHNSNRELQVDAIELFVLVCSHSRTCAMEDAMIIVVASISSFFRAEAAKLF